MTLTIHGDDIGLPENHTVGTSKGFGLTLVSMLREQLNGTFSIDSDDGTTSVVEFDR